MQAGAYVCSFVCLFIHGLRVSICWIRNPEGIKASPDVYKSLYIANSPNRNATPASAALYHMDECAHHRI